MIEYILWIASFVGLFLTIFWLQVVYLSTRPAYDYNPKDVTIIVPAYNEERNIAKNLASIADLDYPRDKLKAIVVNDGSIDNTVKEVEKFISAHPELDIKLISHEKNSGHKGAALNTGLQHVTTEFFGCLDADSTVTRNSLKLLMRNLYDDKIAAVISATKASNTHSFLEKLQRFDYIFAAYGRHLMAKINTLHVTPGVLSVYRTDVVKQLGYFDAENITEDFEIAMRLLYHGYSIKMEPASLTYTTIPSRFKQFWKQRVRWYRGLLYNSARYKQMFMNRKYGAMGTFQFPVTVATVLLIYALFFVSMYEILSRLYEFLVRIVLVKSGIIYIFKDIDFTSALLAIDIKLWFPLSVSFLLGLIIYNKAFKSTNENWQYPLAVLAYFTIYPVIRGFQWVTALYDEVIRKKRKW